MNIDEYREMKAKLEKEEGAKETPEPETEVQPEVVEEETEAKEEPSKEDLEEESKPETIVVDGVELTIDELKQGYMRQSDYTRKTQEVKRERESVEEALSFMERLQSNPQVAQQLSHELDMPNLDPNTARHRDLENKYYDLLVETQVRELRDKYGEFDVKAVLETAYDNRLEDLEAAYHIVQGRSGASEPHVEPNIEQIREDLKAELMKELRSELEANVDTSTIINSSGGQAPVRDEGPRLSPREIEVARNMGMDPKEYAKWRDAK